MKSVITIVCMILFISGYTFPQFDVLEKIKKKTEEKVKEETDKTIDDALEGDEKSKEDSVKEVKTTDESNTTSTENVSSTKELKSYSKFDFVPGENVLFFEDFSQDNVGDFPALWNTNSGGEVVTFNNYSGHWFQFGNNGVFMPDITGTFGENFTLEFDLIYAPPARSNLPDFVIEFISGKQENEAMTAYIPGNSGCGYRIGAHGNRVYNWKDRKWGDINNNNASNFLYKNLSEKVHISFSFQKQRVRQWLNEEKIYDLPKLLSAGVIIDHIRFTTFQTNEKTPYLFITNLRVAVGPPDMRNKLITEGKLVTRGILFDVNRADIKAESYGTLKEIANVLKENADVKVKIIGHTDSDGDENKNLDLSKRRAESVKNMLAKEFGIDENRMETDGMGETKPVDKNDSSAGKANNRRVEFIKK